MRLHKLIKGGFPANIFVFESVESEGCSDIIFLLNNLQLLCMGYGVVSSRCRVFAEGPSVKKLIFMFPTRIWTGTLSGVRMLSCVGIRG